MTNDTVELLHPTARKVFLGYSIVLLVSGIFGNVLLLSTLVYKTKPVRMFRNSIKLRRRSVTQSISGNFSQPDQQQQQLLVHRKNAAFRSSSLSSADFLLLCVTISEFITIWVIILRFVVYLSLGIDFQKLSTAACKIHFFLSKMFIHSTVALLCIFTAHRALSMTHPLKVKKWITHTRLRLLIGCSVGMILFKNCSILALFQLIDSGGHAQCSIPEPKNGSFNFKAVYFFGEFVSHSVLGYMFLIIFNTWLYVVMWNYQKKSKIDRRSAREAEAVRSEDTGRQQPKRISKAEAAISASRVIMLQSVVQVLFTTPYFTLVEFYKKMNWTFFPKEHEITVYYACILPIYTNNAFNYIFVCIASPTIRKMSVKLLRNLTCRTKS